MLIENTKKYCSKEKLKNNFKKRSHTHHTLLFFYQEKAKLELSREVDLSTESVNQLIFFNRRKYFLWRCRKQSL